ncbi:hypothetical protein CSAL01_00771 [Colletotrichum salicis]|uniref:Heterokaryon incompatibility domain-containing protein n=1 Tax=Colletotrichum salicis TaxID=1209931 RepID=A0A135RV81_9PEZI|nr:hypothetical protein CSAL01_00771 [Colletotrichum salicis]
MESFRAGIQVGPLPKTYRDTISILKRLGLRYLWIDSLCIIQDSVDDWRKESITMAEVYRNGVINIAATAALLVYSSKVISWRAPYRRKERLSRAMATSRASVRDVPIL